MSESFYKLSAFEITKLIQSADMTALELVDSCLARIESREESVQAWEHLDKSLILSQSRDIAREDKRPLAGVPVGIKDIIDTDNMPTTYGSQIFKNHHPPKNAVCIDRLIKAGAIIFGKTVTTEFAFLNSGKTSNPHNNRHTPGGSSSGSAAAVADFHVPLALGTQTAGSIIRPASYCGVVGYKPTFASFPIDGIHPLAVSFDTLGGFARTVGDIILLSEVLAEKKISKDSRKPEKIAILLGPDWSAAEPEMEGLFERLPDLIKEHEVELDVLQRANELKDINAAHKVIMMNDCVSALKNVYANNRNSLSDILLDEYESALKYDNNDLRSAKKIIEDSKRFMAALFEDYDLLLMPASTGRAPAGLEATGDPAFNRMTSALQLPCLNLPYVQTQNDLPLGVQLVGAYMGDEKLLSHSLWLEKLFKDQNPSR
jgi:Asp-tRNA(Asn)/Glu-tRNA(Gln) amidotransferase A subunit family amidase